MNGSGRRAVLAVMAGVVVLLGAALGAATNIGTEMLPAWWWLHSPAVIWSVVALSVLLLIVLATVQQRISVAETPPFGVQVRHLFVPQCPADARPAMMSLRPPQVTDGAVRGRDRLVDQLSAVRGRHRSRVNVLYAMGGAGKTTIAQLVAGRLARAGVQVWWVSAATATQLDTGMRQLAAELGASIADIEQAWSDTGSGPDLVWSRLDRLTQRWLLVIDNADDIRLLAPPDESVAAGRGWIRPISNRRGSLLVTTRDGDRATWPAGHRGAEDGWYQLHPVGMLGLADGAAVLLDLAGAGAGTVDEATRLAERLGGLPLAIGVAGQTLRQVRDTGVAGSPATFAAYRIALDAGRTPASVPAAGSLNEAQVRRTIDRTWELSLDLLDSRGLSQARTLLGLLATFADAPIPTYLLDPVALAACGLLPDLTGERLVALLQALSGVGLVTLQRAQRSTSMTLAQLHPLIRDTSRPRDIGYPAVVGTLLRQCTTDLDPDEPVTWPTWQIFAPHTIDLFRRATPPGIDDETVVEVCDLTQLTGCYLGAAGLHRSARDLFAALLPVRERVQGAEHPATLSTRHELARWIGAAGDPAAARDLFAGLLPLRERVQGVEHLDTLLTRSDLADWTGAAGDPAAARDLFAALLPVRLRVQGAEHPDILAIRSNLAYWTGMAGDPAGARDLFAALLPIGERVQGAEHPTTLATWHDLAYWTGRAGDPARARYLLAAVLPVYERIRGAEHPDTLLTRRELAYWTREVPS